MCCSIPVIHRQLLIEIRNNWTGLSGSGGSLEQVARSALDLLLMNRPRISLEPSYLGFRLDFSFDYFCIIIDRLAINYGFSYRTD